MLFAINTIASALQMPQHIHLHVLARELARSTLTMLLVLELKMLLCIVHMSVIPQTVSTLRMQVFFVRVSNWFADHISINLQKSFVSFSYSYSTVPGIHGSKQTESEGVA